MEYLAPELKHDDILAQSNLTLAYVGDGVYELMVRTWLCAAGAAKPGTLHKTAVEHVRAPAQAAAFARILPLLDEEERQVYQRGRNAHVGAIPRGATSEQYHSATGLEALFGYLYLKGRRDRLEQLFSRMVEEEA